MSRQTAARLAGFAFLFYIVVGIAGMKAGGSSAAATFLQIAPRACAVILAVTLFIVTRPAGIALATVGMLCRLLEGVGDPLMKLMTGGSLTFNTNGLIFAVGSLCFTWLMLRGRMIPAGLAWLGVVASVLLVVVLPLQMAGALPAANWSGGLTWMIWMPMLAFEIPLAFWLMIKAV